MLSETLVFSIDNAVMIVIGLLLVLLALFKDYEPAFFLPVGFSAILVNMPHFGPAAGHMIGSFLYTLGIQSNLFPLLLLIGLGTMLDFGYLLSRPGLLLYGMTVQFGILVAFVLSPLVGFGVKEAASTGMIAALNTPVSIFIPSNFTPQLIAPITLAVFLFRSISPAILLKLSSVFWRANHRSISADDQPRPVSSRARILFPIFITIIFGLLLPGASLLIGMLMLGNLLKESNLVERLSRTAQNELTNIITLLLGLAIGFKLTPETLLTMDTLLVFGLGFVAVILNTIAGFLFGKLMVWLSHGKVNPFLCLVGIIPFPLSGNLISLVVQKQNSGDGFIEPALAINSGVQLINVILGCIFIALIM